MMEAATGSTEKYWGRRNAGWGELRLLCTKGGENLQWLNPTLAARHHACSPRRGINCVPAETSPGPEFPVTAFPCRRGAYRLDGFSEVLLLPVLPYNRTGQRANEIDPRDGEGSCPLCVRGGEALKETKPGTQLSAGWFWGDGGIGFELPCTGQGSAQKVLSRKQPRLSPSPQPRALSGLQLPRPSALFSL